MATRELPREEWKPFLNEFSTLHQGEKASLEVIGDDVGDQEEANSLPFVGVSVDTKGSEAGAIMIMLGTEADDHLEHLIVTPTHLRIKVDGDLEQDVLEIEDEDGIKTILHLAPIERLPKV